jgi:hypothetical protein
LVAALAALPREVDPPAHVAAALQASVRARRPGSSRPNAWRVALAASLLAVAFAAGRWSAPGSPVAPDRGRDFVFLLYGGAPSGTDDNAKAYGAWAMDLRQRGVPVSGERLADAAWTAGDPRPADAAIRGFFIVRAPDAAAAVEMARRHPHARVGTIEVRPVDTP